MELRRTKLKDPFTIFQLNIKFETALVFFLNIKFNKTCRYKSCSQFRLKRIRVIDPIRVINLRLISPICPLFKVNPYANVSDWLFGVAAVVIIANLVLISTIGVRNNKINFTSSSICFCCNISLCQRILILFLIFIAWCRCGCIESPNKSWKRHGKNQQK